jgi:hypothetical protein
VVFGSNTATSYGSDIADNSTSGYLIYTTDSVVGSSSNSSGASIFYIIQGSTGYKYDCLLSTDQNGCVVSPQYVSITNGFDFGFCGDSASPCASLTQSIQNIKTNGGENITINVDSGSYTDTFGLINNIEVIISTQSTTKPVFSLISPPIGATAMLSIGLNGKLTINGTILTYNVVSGSNNIVLLLTASITGILTVINSDFKLNGSALVPHSFIRHTGGTISISGSTFSVVVLSSFALIRYAGVAAGTTGTDPLVLNISTSLFTNIESTGDFGTVISTPTPKAYKLTLANVNITNSNQTTTLNRKGMISISSISGSTISLTEVTIDSVKLDSSVTNGSISITGSAEWLMVDTCSFINCRTGQNGGGIYLNVSSWGNTGNTVIQNTTFIGCAAVYGGAICINGIGVKLFLCHFEANNKTTSGSDIYENKNAAATFYSTSTVELCCSDSDPPLFSLNDGNDLDYLLPSCGAPSLFVSNNGNDNNNQCKISSNPCRSISQAITSGTNDDSIVILVFVVGDYDAIGTAVISAGIELYIETVNTSSVASGIKYSSSITTTINLFSTTTGQIEAKNLKLQLGGSTKGSFFSVTGSGLVTIMDSSVISDNQGACQYPFVVVTGNGQVYIISVSVSGLTFSPQSSSNLPLINFLGSLSLSILTSNFTSFTSSSTGGAIFSDSSATGTRTMLIYLNNTNFTQISNSQSTQGIIGTVIGSTSSNVTFHNIQFNGGITGSSSGSILGGSLYIGSSLSFEVDGCLFTGITGVSIGGGFYVNRTNAIKILNSNFSNIQVSTSGGMVDICKFYYFFLFIYLFLNI